MTAFLGFDRERVEMLRNAMHRSVVDLTELRSSDPEATLLMRRIHNDAEFLSSSWLPRLDQLVGSRTLVDFVRVSITPMDLANATLLIREADRGWQIVTDSTGSRPVSMRAIDAEALAHQLNEWPSNRPFDAHQLTILSSQLAEIAGRPELVDAFLTNLTTNTWTQLCNSLGLQHLAASEALLFEGPIGTPVEKIDAIFGSLGAILVNDHQRHPYSAATELTDQMQPYAAAMLTQHLEYSAEQLAQASAAIIQRAYAIADFPSEWDYSTAGSPELLMQAMLQVNGAPTLFANLLHDQPALLIGTTNDSDLLARFLATATDPQNMSSTDAGQLLVTLLPYVTNGDATWSRYKVGDAPRYTVVMADLVAPWMVHFTFGQPADWPIDSQRGIRLLAALMNDDQAFDRLVSNRAAILAPVAESGSINALARLLGLFDTLAREATIHGAQVAHAAWDLTWAIAGVATSLIPGFGLVASAGWTVGQTLLQDRGIATVDVDAVEHDTLLTLEWQSTIATASVINANFDAMIVDELIASNTLRPPAVDLGWPTPAAQYSVLFEDWLRGQKPDIARQFNEIKQTLLSENGAQGNAVELTLG